MGLGFLAITMVITFLEVTTALAAFGFVFMGVFGIYMLISSECLLDIGTSIELEKSTLNKIKLFSRSVYTVGCLACGFSIVFPIVMASISNTAFLAASLFLFKLTNPVSISILACMVLLTVVVHIGKSLFYKRYMDVSNIEYLLNHTNIKFPLNTTNTNANKSTTNNQLYDENIEIEIDTDNNVKTPEKPSQDL